MQRLRQILNPFELQQVQIAAGYQIDKLKPAVITDVVVNAVFSSDASTGVLVQRSLFDEYIVLVGRNILFFSAFESNYNTEYKCIFKGTPRIDVNSIRDDILKQFSQLT
uniref:BPH_3 domain-containing protein n=1 Tax=Panagrellus redivivus TaxID=6233 RepID=A0A7E4VM13_PANRE